MNYFNWIEEIVVDILYLLHFSHLPNHEDIKDYKIFEKAVIAMAKNYLYDINILRQIYNLKFFNERTQSKINNLRYSNKNV